jgi:hypothetical protein
MSRSNWLYVLAAGALLAFNSPSLSQQPDTSLEHQPIPETRQQAGANQGQANAAEQQPNSADLAPALKAVEGAIRELIPKDDSIERQRQEQREISDLQAQQEMAVWAKLMFWASLGGVALTFGGLILIYRTLHHTRRAADYARDMIEEAEKTTRAAVVSAEAAREAVEQAKETNRIAAESIVLDQRPWLILDFDLARVSFTQHSVSATCTVTIRNIGKSPALATPIGFSFSKPFPSDSVQKAARQAQEFLNTSIPPNVIPQGEPAQIYTVNATEDYRPSSTIDFVATVLYRMIGSIRTFETTVAVRAHLPAAGSPDRVLGDYTGEIKLMPLFESKMT